MPGAIARAKSKAGGQTKIQTLASAATLTLPDEADVFLVSGTTAVTSLSSTKIFPGRHVTLIGANATGNVFTNTSATTTAGQMDLGGQDRTLTLDDVMTIVQQNNGAWRLQAIPQITPTAPTLTAASAVALTDGIDSYLINGSGTAITTLTTTNVRLGRIVTIVGASATSTFANNTGTSTSGQMDLAGANRAIQTNDAIQLFQRANGTWNLVSVMIG